jgi:hypothetical protein
MFATLGSDLRRQPLRSLAELTSKRRASPSSRRCSRLSNVLFWSLSGLLRHRVGWRSLCSTPGRSASRSSSTCSGRSRSSWPTAGSAAAACSSSSCPGRPGESRCSGGRRREKAPDAAFFLTPFPDLRASAGRPLSLARRRSPASRRWRREGGDARRPRRSSAIAVAAYTPEHRFPGLAAMVPCGGAALAIVAGRGRLAGALLANRLPQSESA